MRWLINHAILVLIYATFVVAGSLYLRGFILYRGIDTWPSVDAEVVRAGGTMVSVPMQTRYGARSSTIDARFIEFRYSVDGKVFVGNKATPDAGGWPINPTNRPWRAFYKPGSPDIAVLEPIPFRGTGFLITAVFTGVIVLVHLWFTVPSLLAKIQKTEPGGGSR